MEKKFTLIVPTLGRKKELIELIRSLEDCYCFETLSLVIVDQNSKEFSLKKTIIGLKSKLHIEYFYSNQKGLSHNRNLALKKADLYDYVLFTDDDNIFDKYFFKHLLTTISSNEYDLIVANALNYENKLPYTYKINQKQAEKISLRSFKKIISWNIILNKQTLNRLGFFDESFGVGAKYGACEESDFITRLLVQKQTKSYSNPKCKVFHRRREKNYNNFERNIKYAKGFGAFYKKQIITHPLKVKLFFAFDFFKLMAVSFAGLFLYIFNYNRRKHYINSIIFKIVGFKEYNNR